MFDPLYKCYITVLSMMNDRHYTPEDHCKEKIDENTFLQTYKTLELEFVKNTDPNHKIFVFFVESAKKNQIDNLGKKEIVEKFIPKMKKKKIKHLILVLKDIKVTSSANSEINSHKPNYLIEYFDFTELIINITEHVLVPKHIPLEEHEKYEILEKYKSTEDQFPKISDEDPVSRYLGLQKGDMVEIIRISESKGLHKYYRVCESQSNLRN